MFVFNNCANDARVLKEAKTLTEAGHEVEIVAFLDKKTLPSEERHGFTITRIKLNPIHLRIIRFFGNPVMHITRRASAAQNTALEASKEPKGLFGKLQHNIERLDKKKGKQIESKYQVELHQHSVTHPKSRATVSDLIKKNPSFLLSLILFSIAYLPVKSLVVARNLILKAIIKTVRFFIQKPLRWMLLPFHKYFTYHNFYKNALKYSKNKELDVVQCHDLNTLKIGIELKKLQGVKLVYDSHELYLHKNRLKPAGRFKTKILKGIEMEGMMQADAVITVGACIASWLAEQYETKAPFVIHNAPALRTMEEVDTSLNLRSALEISPSEFLLVYSGGITFNRGLEQVIEAASRIDNLRFVMMGYGSEEYMDSLSKRIKKFKAEDKIQFFGPVPHQEVASYLSSADCGIAPIINICLSYYYCAPNKLFEFVQARLPILASNFPEMEKVVQDADLGYTFDPENPDAIEEVIKKMMNNEERRKEFREHTHSAAKRYNWKVEEEKLIGIYKSLAS